MYFQTFMIINSKFCNEGYNQSSVLLNRNPGLRDHIISFIICKTADDHGNAPSKYLQHHVRDCDGRARSYWQKLLTKFRQRFT